MGLTSTDTIEVKGLIDPLRDRLDPMFSLVSVKGLGFDGTDLIETFLVRNVIDICKALNGKHHIYIY